MKHWYLLTFLVCSHSINALTFIIGNNQQTNRFKHHDEIKRDQNNSKAFKAWLHANKQQNPQPQHHHHHHCTCNHHHQVSQSHPSPELQTNQPQEHTYAPISYTTVEGSQHWHQERQKALAQDIAQYWKCEQHSYSLSPGTKQFLDNLELNSSALLSLHGSALQHCLHQEILSCLEDSAELYDNTIHDTLKIFAQSTAQLSFAADSCNRALQIDQSCRILDFCHNVLNYSGAILLAAGDGIIEGIHNTLHCAHQLCNGAIFAYNNPHDALIFAHHAAQSLIKLINAYCPLDKHTFKVFGTSEYEDQMEHVVQNWENLIASFYQELSSKSTPELVQAATCLATEWLLPEKILSALGLLIKASAHELSALNIAERLSLTNRPTKLPGFLLLYEASTYHNIVNKIPQFNLNLEQKVIDQALINLQLPEIGGNLEHLYQGIQSFEKTPGFEEILDRIMKAYDPKCFSTAKGANWELESGLYIQAKEEIVINFGKKAPDQSGMLLDFDIETPTRLIECKNMYWVDKVNSKSPNSTEKIRKLTSWLGQHKSAADIYGKSYVIYSKQSIPISWQDWLIKKQINFMEII